MKLFTERGLRRFCLSMTTVFVGCFGAAMVLYPGGTWFDRQTRGHSMWKNFLCDLLHEQALNGADNRLVSRLMRTGMLAMLAGLAAFFALVPALEREETRAGRLARRAGVLACALCCAVPLTPSDVYPRGHIAAVLVACVPALFAVPAALVVCLRSPRASMAVRALAALTLVNGVLDTLGYAYAAATTTHLLDWTLPVFQRLALFALLGWIVALCAGVANDRSEAPAPARAP